MFSSRQNEQLAAPLNRSAVKTREIGGRTVSYIDGWHAIEQSNAIFGFDGWSRETLLTACVMDQERTLGKAPNTYPGFGVTYICKVKITVYSPDGAEAIREGCGAGHGMDRDRGLAHESALKEAETDAMKRALMTFGNPFGLALYDKTQSNVVDEKVAAMIERKLAFIDACKGQIDAFTNKAELSAWWTSADEKKARRDHGLSDGEVALLVAQIVAKGEALDNVQG